jgi:meiotically up-regulated gene 157 (Mug157) protein
VGPEGDTCGLVRSGFRPSDDPVKKPYNIPGNSLLAIELRKLAMGILADAVSRKDNNVFKELMQDFSRLSMRIESSLKQHSVGKVKIGNE